MAKWSRKKIKEIAKIRMKAKETDDYEYGMTK